MKRIITLALSIIFTMSAFGQRLEYDQTSKWFFGLNAGATWNTTDVQNKTYAGWGFLLGRSYNYDYGRKFSYDLRLRYLRGKWYGQDSDSTNLDNLGADYTGALADYKNNLGYTVNNYEANVHELGLELVIHANRFRDRTGWDPYIFGGVNVVWNETYGDLINQGGFLASDTLYQYDQIDMNKPAIESALDENYESVLDGTAAGNFNVNFMPSLGIGLGYDFGPRFSMGLEHKTTFALKDDFDGYIDAEPQIGFLENDVYHYTSAYMTWRFRGRGQVRTRPTPTPDPNPPIIGGSNTPCQFPDVRITRPLQRTENVETQGYVFRAEVNFVQSRSEIVMRVNGIETTNFLYNRDTHQLESYLNLQPGNNTIKITGRNSCGTDVETSTIIFNDCIDPVVYFENVCGNTFTAQVEQRSYTVQAQISNATSVEFTVNGVRSTNFAYNSTTGQFSSNILLNQGQNNIRITAVSACGTDTGTSVVTYTDCADPLVNFTNGNNGFASVSQPNFDLSAYVYNVVNASNVKVRLNGSNRNFNLSTSTNLLTASLVLKQGQNTIQITATNNCGSETETLTIEYIPCVNPSIQIIQPLAQSTVSANGTQVVRANLFNVANMNQIQLFVNGNLQQGGSYNAITRMFEASVALNSGLNTIQITVLNDCGSDTETISVNYNPCSTPDVQLILPSANGGLVSSPSQLVQAMVFNVNNISEIQTFVNGTLQNGGTYTSVNGLYQNTVGLTLGVNTIQVVATNSCGSDVETVTITYRACEAPVITLTAPNTNPFFTNATNMTVSATVGSITSATQVQLTVNGVVDALGATYTSGSLLYSNNVALNAGNNVIRVTATNSCGTVTKEVNVIREIVVITTPIEDSIVICYPHSNNVGTPVTMTIPLSSWPAYQSQGAQLGPCPVIVDPIDLPMTICYTIVGTPTTVQILTSEWPAYQALGATQGACPIQTMNICFNNNQLTIPVSQWSLYQGQGATEGPCPVVVEEKIIICHKPIGDPTNTQEMEIPVSEWAMHQAHGDVLGPCPTIDPDMTICLDGRERIILTSQWVNYQAQGATQGPCPVVDPPMTICFVVNGVRTTMDILTSEWASYQAQGASQGPCPSIPDPSITICTDVNGVPTTMTILASEWATYQAQGATMGACIATSDPSIPICLNGAPMTILTSELPSYLAQGATQGPCPVVDPPMTICVVVNRVRTTMDILTSEWPTYQAQGAIQGPCPTVANITICLDVNGVPTTMLIQPSEWGAYQSQGATLGACVVDSTITICSNGKTKDILASEWPLYQAQGATQGPCTVVNQERVIICFGGEELEIFRSGLTEYIQQGATEGPCPDEPEMTICFVLNNVRTTMKIPISQWPTYQNQGAIEGPCPSVVDPEVIICMEVNGVPTTMSILTSEWPAYQSQGATQGPCIENPDTGGTGNEETLNVNTVNPIGASGGEEELLFGNRTITICHTPKGSIASQTMQIPINEWETYQLQGASLGACAGAVPSGGTETIDLNTNGKGNGGVSINPKDSETGNGSQKANQEALRKQQEAAAAKARLEKAAAKKAAVEQEAARRKAEEVKRKAAQEASAAKARQEQARKEAAAKKAAARRKADQEAKAAAAKKEADAAKKKAEEQRKTKEKEGGR